MIINKNGYVRSDNGAKDANEFFKMAFESLKGKCAEKGEIECLLVPKDAYLEVKRYAEHVRQLSIAA